MGMTFPLLTDLVARRDSAHGADVGRAYALNTIGSIAGAVLTGFVLVVVLGTDITLRLGLVLSAAAALTLAALAARGVPQGSEQHRRLMVRVVGGGLLAMVGLATAVAAPRWSTRLIDLGPTIYARQPMNAAGLRAYLGHRGVRQLAYREGANATVSVWESEAGRSLKVNGKADASDHGDMDTEIMLGLAPAAARANASSALVIGYGSGVTARVLADVPGMQRVRVVEIEPAVIAMDRFFTHVNDSVLVRPTVSVVVDDARSALQLHRDRFDVGVALAEDGTRGAGRSLGDVGSLLQHDDPTAVAAADLMGDRQADDPGPDDHHIGGLTTHLHLSFGERRSVRAGPVS